MFSRLVLVTTLLLVGSLAGCRGFDPIPNPSFDVTVEQAQQALADLANRPAAAPRPVLLVGGYFNVTGSQIRPMRDALHASFGEHAVLTKTHFAFSNFERLRDQLIAEVDERFGAGDDPSRTVPVDGIGMSMGGLVLRYAALPDGDRRTLQLKRLYTVGTPHRGAAWGTRWSVDRLVRDMKIGSNFIQRLDAHPPNTNYTLTPYVRLHDRIVGEQNAAPPGQSAIWLSPLPHSRAHADALEDPRIMADILRRLRGETPLSSDLRTPLPE